MKQAWLNGVMMAEEAARIHPRDRGFALGDGVFETIRAEGGQPAHLPRHFKRLKNGAAVLNIELPFSERILASALREVAAGADCALRLTLTRGPMARGVLPEPRALPTMLITATALPKPAAPARVIISARTRRNEFSPLSGIKSLNYGDSLLARLEAAELGADDALLLNTRGFLAEASAACVFLVIDGCLVTPPLADGALPGIGRALMLRGTKAVERQVSQTELGRATAGVLVNALERRSIALLEGRTLEAIQGL